MAVQDDNTIVNKGDLKELYQNKILPYLGGNLMVQTNNSDYYSTDEKVVGVWTDGKPVYQTCCYVNQNMADESYISYSTGITTVDTLIKMEGLTYNESSKYYRNFPFVQDNATDQNATLQFDVDTGNIRIWSRTKTSASSFYVGYVILRYTKTTDSAGSATATAGAYDINFPNTWAENTEIYFGNGLYGQRFVKTTAISANTQYKLVAGVSRIVSYGGSMFRTGDGYAHQLGQTPGGGTVGYPYIYIDTATMTSGTGYLSIWGNITGGVGCDIWVTYCR